MSAINPPSSHRTALSMSATERPLSISTPLLFGAATVLLLALFQWPQRWLISGAPSLTFLILLGAARGTRVLSFMPVSSLVVLLNVAYYIAATSWLLYGLFIVICYPLMFLTCVFQFSVVSGFVRRCLRSLLKQLQFVNDRIALFDIPALEIDTDVDGLMVIRGMTISLSDLTIVAHGVEVGIKLSDDMELAIQAEKVTIPLFRKVQISDCYANLKGGAYEMTFGDMPNGSHDSDGNALMLEDTPLLKAAAQHGDMSRPKMVKMTSKMTHGHDMEDSSAMTGFRAMTQMSPKDKLAYRQYENTLRWIEESSTVRQTRDRISKRAKVADSAFDTDNLNDLRAAICSAIHDKPSVPHPPRMSIKVTTLQNLSPPWVRRFLHRLPMLLRLLLSVLSYFHPVYIDSITAAGSGKWIAHMLQEKVFKDYGQDNAELRKLEAKVSAWLSDANFALELADITGIAQVPFMAAFDILCLLKFEDVMAYRTLPKQLDLSQVIRLGGADANFAIPSFLLPHHEHLIPPKPAPEDAEELRQEAEEADGKPKTLQKERDAKQVEKDEANVKISAHAKLPAVLDQELLNFISALVKATKVIELEKAPNAMDQEVSSLKEFAQSLKGGVRDSMKKVVVDTIVNDGLIAKLVGKVTKQLETAYGDVGYSGDIPVALDAYRLPEGSPEALKLLA